MAANNDAGQGLTRPRYFDRQQLTADDLRLEQAYLDSRLRRLNRYLHGWGVVCGGQVETLPQSGPNVVVVGETFAISPRGDQIYIPPGQPPLDLKTLIADRCGCESGDCGDLSEPRDADRSEQPKRVYLVVSPQIQLSRSRPAFPDDCDHPGNHQQPSRQCDSFVLDILCELPAEYTDLDCETLDAIVCRKAQIVCPPDRAADENFVVLAELQLAEQVIASIDYTSRKRLLPVELLQRMAECSCHAPPRVTPAPDVTPTLFPPATTIFPTSLPPIGTVTLLPPISTATLLPPFVTRVTIRPPSVTVVTFNPGINPLPSPFTQPAPFDPGLVRSVDSLRFDVNRGQATSIDELVLLSSADRAALRDMGVRNVLQLYAANSTVLKQVLGISDVRAAEYKNNALQSVRRASPITLDAAEFDLSTGADMPVERVMNIGVARGAKLRKQGYASVLDVANADPTSVAEVMDVSPTTAAEMVEDARNLIRRTQ